MQKAKVRFDGKNAIIGFIGLGVMGHSMASRIMEAGYELHVYNRTRAKATDLEKSGAIWEESPAAIARTCDVVITIVGFPPDVEEIYLGPEGLIASAPRGICLIDMTTSRPDLAIRIHDEARRRGIFALDAPVSGGDTGAREGKLSIMVGGDGEVFESVRPILSTMGTNIVHQGSAGSGQHTKMVNQIVIASGMVGICEALGYAARANLDLNKVLQSISSGAAGSWSLSNLAPRMLAGDVAPGFFVKHFIKDMTIASQSAEDIDADLPGLENALSLYRRLAEEGGENDGTQALYRLFQK